MKKLLACGLILSTLMSFGSVCFAGWEDDYIEEGIEESQSPKKPRTPRENSQEIMAKKREKERQFQNLRDQAIALLSGYYEEGYGLIWYTCIELSDMKIGDLSEDCTVLKAVDVEKQLPQVVSKTLKEYLELREELYPETMMEHHPLFISVYGLYTEGIASSNVCRCAKKWRKQLDLAFYDVTEVRSTITKLKDKAISYLYSYFQEENIKYVAEKLSKMKLGDIVSLQQSLILDSTSIKIPKAIWDVLWEYLDYREAFFPETMKYGLPLFINTINPKQAAPMTVNGVNYRIQHYREPNGETAYMEKE